MRRLSEVIVLVLILLFQKQCPFNISLILFFELKYAYLLEDHEKDILEALVSFWQTSGRTKQVIQNHHKNF